MNVLLHVILASAIFGRDEVDGVIKVADTGRQNMKYCLAETNRDCRIYTVWERVIITCTLKNSEYDQEIPHSQTADKPMAFEEELHNNHNTSGRQTKQSN